MSRRTFLNILRYLLPLSAMLFGYYANGSVPENDKGASAVTSCATGNGFVSTDGQTIFVNGVINQKTAACFTSAVGTQTKEVRVRSPGGEIPASLEIAEEIEQFSLPIEIDEICASSCASYLLAASSRISSPKPSIVLFHQTATSSLTLTKGIYAGASQLFGGLAERELALYHRHH